MDVFGRLAADIRLGVLFLIGVHLRWLCLGLLPVIFQSLHALRKHGSAAVQCLGCCEFVAGAADLSKGLKEKGLRGVNLDLSNAGIYQNTMSAEGMICAIAWIMQLKPRRSRVHYGTVCSSWVWTNSSVTNGTKSVC